MLARSGNRELATRPQVIETKSGFKITDPCLAMQVSKGCNGDLSKLLSDMDAFFGKK